MHSSSRTSVSGLFASAIASLVLGSAATVSAQTADLAVSVSVPNPSDTVYAAAVTNNGPGTASNVAVAVSLPTGIIAISVAPSPACAFSFDATTVNCALGSLASGATTTVDIVLYPFATGTKTVTANVSATEADPIPANNSASGSAAINSVGIAEMSVTLVDFPDPLSVGSGLVYVATVTNNFDDNGHDVVLTFPLPNNVTFLGAGSERGACTLSGRTVRCPLGDFNVQESVRAAVVVVPLQSGFLLATASISSSTVADPNIVNNAATTRSWVNP
jgi:uncharacterized repeat protein (TIGR01451 family)